MDGPAAPIPDASRVNTNFATITKRFRQVIPGQQSPPLLLLWLLAVPAITPLIQPTLSRSADGLLHLYRLVALGQALQQGAFFPRWLPDLAYGYGLPLFVFYAPLSYYLSAGLNLLGLDAVSALNASFALALLASGSGVYLFVKDLFGPRAGLLAGVAYVYAPYQLYNILWRGSLPIAWAAALFPFAFWAFGRLIRSHKPIYLPLSTLAAGAALLTHNISSLIFLPLLALFLALELLNRPNRRTLLRVALALTLALGLAAFFLTAIIEREFAQVERVITPPDFDYHFNFVDFKELFTLPPPANTGLLNPQPPFSLGLVQTGLAALGLLGLLVWPLSTSSVEREPGHPGSGPASRPRPPTLSQISGPEESAGATDAPHPSKSAAISLKYGRRPRLRAAFAALALSAAIFMMLPISVGVWDRLPLIAFVQQPHRLLSLTAFLLALLTGGAAAVLPYRAGFWLTLGGAVLLFLTAVPLLYPRYYAPLPAPPTLPGMMAYERATGAIGTTSFGEYLPRWVRQIPRQSPLEPLYQAGLSIQRLDPAYLPAGTRLEAARYGFNRAELVIDAPEPYQAVFHTFYFPGWEARIDGQPQTPAPVSERGLIGVTMPPGRRELQLYFRETPVRLAANGISILALMIVIYVTFRATRRPGSRFALRGAGFPVQTPAVSAASFSTGQFAVLAGLAIALIIGKTLYLDRFDSPLKRVFDGSGVASAGVSKQVNFGHQINLLGYDLAHRRAAPGQTFELTAYWQARQPLATNYSALAQLVDEQGHLYGGQDNLHPGNLPTSRWEAWGFVRDPHRVRVPPGTPPGAYFLITGLYEAATGARLPVIEGGDSGWSDVAALPVTVVKPDRRPALAELGITWPVTTEAAADSGIRLLGAAPERDAIRRNDFLRIALFWETTARPAADYRVSLRLLAVDGTVVREETGRPSHGRYPTLSWATGERVRDNQALSIPPDFPAGSYRLQVRLVAPSEAAAGEWIELGQLSVEE